MQFEYSEQNLKMIWEAKTLAQKVMQFCKDNKVKAKNQEKIISRNNFGRTNLKSSLSTVRPISLQNCIKNACFSTSDLISKLKKVQSPKAAALSLEKTKMTLPFDLFKTMESVTISTPEKPKTRYFTIRRKKYESHYKPKVNLLEKYILGVRNIFGTA